VLLPHFAPPANFTVVEATSPPPQVPSWLVVNFQIEWTPLGQTDGQTDTRPLLHVFRHGLSWHKSKKKL